MKKIILVLLITSSLFASTWSLTSMYYATGSLSAYISGRMASIIAQMSMINSAYESKVEKQIEIKNKHFLKIQQLDTLILLEEKSIVYNENLIKEVTNAK